MNKTEWVVSLDGKIRTRQAIDEDLSDYICQMPFSTAREADQMPEADRNARLISAAPEILAALLQAKDRILELHGKYYREYSRDTLDIIDSAIAKAYGRKG